MIDPKNSLKWKEYPTGTEEGYAGGGLYLVNLWVGEYSDCGCYWQARIGENLISEHETEDEAKIAVEHAVLEALGITQ